MEDFQVSTGFAECLSGDSGEDRGFGLLEPSGLFARNRLTDLALLSCALPKGPMYRYSTM